MEGEDSRLFKCRRCGVRVRICRSCDHGNVYCAKGCSEEGRRESVGRAGRKHQKSDKGRIAHKVRQQKYLERKEQKMTHQGSHSQEVDTNFYQAAKDEAEASHEKPGNEAEKASKCEAAVVSGASAVVCVFREALEATAGEEEKGMVDANFHQTGGDEVRTNNWNAGAEGEEAGKGEAAVAYSSLPEAAMVYRASAAAFFKVPETTTGKDEDEAVYCDFCGCACRPGNRTGWLWRLHAERGERRGGRHLYS